MPQDLSQQLATTELSRCWLSIIGTRPIPVAGTRWERTVVLGVARSDCGAGSATMQQCIHSLRQGMKSLYCICNTISIESRHPFERISNKRQPAFHSVQLAQIGWENADRRFVSAQSLQLVATCVLVSSDAVSANAAVYRSNLIKQRLGTLQELSGDVR